MGRGHVHVHSIVICQVSAAHDAHGDVAKVARQLVIGRVRRRERVEPRPKLVVPRVPSSVRLADDHGIPPGFGPRLCPGINDLILVVHAVHLVEVRVHDAPVAGGPVFWGPGDAQHRQGRIRSADATTWPRRPRQRPSEERTKSSCHTILTSRERFSPPARPIRPAESRGAHGVRSHELGASEVLQVYYGKVGQGDGLKRRVSGRAVPAKSSLSHRGPRRRHHRTPWWRARR